MTTDDHKAAGCHWVTATGNQCDSLHTSPCVLLCGTPETALRWEESEIIYWQRTAKRYINSSIALFQFLASSCLGSQVPQGCCSSHCQSISSHWWCASGKFREPRGASALHLTALIYQTVRSLHATSVACCSLMIIKDLSGVHSTGMYNSRFIKFPMSVLAMYV